MDIQNIERLDQIFDFARAIDREKEIIRQTYLADGSRKEDDAEHAWHMAMMVLLFAEYSNQKIDAEHAMKLAMVHDLVEVYAGDTYAYDEEGKKTQHAREVAAADKLFGLLPDDLMHEFRGYWDEFEAWQTPEARFARLMDNMQPLMLNAAAGGVSWREHHVRLSQVLARNGRSVEGSRQIWAYAYEKFITPSLESGALIDDVHTPGQSIHDNPLLK